MDDHCGCIVSYMYKYKIKLYVDSQFLFPKAQDETMQGVGHDINKICKMSRPMLERDIAKQNPNGGYEENQIPPAPSNICRLVVYDPSIHSSTVFIWTRFPGFK
jgi:hypothetical protein